MFSLQMSAVCGIQGYPAELQASPPCQGLDVQGGQVPKIARSLVGWASQLTAAGLDGLTIIAVPPALDRFPQYNRHYSRGREGPCCCERGARRTWWQAEAAYESREEAWRHLQVMSTTPWRLICLPEMYTVGFLESVQSNFPGSTKVRRLTAVMSAFYCTKTPSLHLLPWLCLCNQTPQRHERLSTVFP